MVFEAALKVMPLSETNNLGRPLWAENRFKLRRNAAVVKSRTTSRCTARVTQQVYRQIHTLLSVVALPTLTKRGPAESTPVNVKGGSSLTLKSGKGGAEGPTQGLPSNFLQMMHWWMTFLQRHDL